jgi:hypothetical protein
MALRHAELRQKTSSFADSAETDLSGVRLYNPSIVAVTGASRT